MRKLPIARLDKPVRVPTDLYVVQSGCAEKRIKIGVACDVTRRMYSMKVDCPYPLTILKVVKGGAHLEYGIHSRFQSSKLQGEWFRNTPELMAVIDSLPDAAHLANESLQSGIPARTVV